MFKNLTPPDYPMSAVADIYDAQAFSIGDNILVHEPAHYPNANKVVASCGAYGYGTERPARIAEWRDHSVTCPRCLEGA